MVRPLNDRILVRIDPEKDTMAGGLLIRPDVAAETIIATGEVLDVGPGLYPKSGKNQGQRISVGVEPGDGLVFIRYHQNTKTNEQLQQYHLGKDKLLLQPNDVLLVYDRKEPVEFS